MGCAFAVLQPSLAIPPGLLTVGDYKIQSRLLLTIVDKATCRG